MSKSSTEMITSEEMLRAELRLKSILAYEKLISLFAKENADPVYYKRVQSMFKHKILGESVISRFEEKFGTSKNIYDYLSISGLIYYIDNAEDLVSYATTYDIDPIGSINNKENDYYINRPSISLIDTSIMPVASKLKNAILKYSDIKDIMDDKIKSSEIAYYFQKKQYVLEKEPIQNSRFYNIDDYVKLICDKFAYYKNLEELNYNKQFQLDKFNEAQRQEIYEHGNDVYSDADIEELKKLNYKFKDNSINDDEPIN